MTGVKLNATQPNIDLKLIVKKTWTLHYGTVIEDQYEITVLLEVTLESQKFETALTFGQGWTQWVLNFRPDGKFSDLIGLVARVFGQPQLPQDLGEYLPGCDQVALRRVVFAMQGDRKTLDAVVQVTFAKMVFLGSLRVNIDQGKTNFSFMGNLFPESRPSRLGPEFAWIPFSPDYEPWTTLEIAAVTNSFGILEDPPASDVGDLGGVSMPSPTGKKQSSLHQSAWSWWGYGSF